MNTSDKAAQLKAHKLLATGLFLLMLAIYIITTWLERAHPAPWMGYVRAFSEAAMVGALADWFAVTALFHHPMGIPIPHTNLIEKGKQAIGNNLGDFVVSNFLTAGNIRPYIDKLTISLYAARWLESERNKKLIVGEAAHLLQDIVGKMDSATISKFLAKKAGDLLDEVKLHLIVRNAMRYFLDKGEHEKLVTLLSQKIKTYISENEDLVREKVKGESYFFIPSFVDNKLAAKITGGLVRYFEEIELDPAHRIRAEVAAQLYSFAEKLGTEKKWEEELGALKNGLLSPQKLEEYAVAAWHSIKATLEEELAREDGPLLAYFHKTIDELANNLKHDPVLQGKIDSWIRSTAYKYILQNTAQVGALISNTVGAWPGRELSRKLELEVGKDLQFIRINGTIVGGAVGLLIYTITRLIG